MCPYFYFPFVGLIGSFLFLDIKYNIVITPEYEHAPVFMTLD